MNLLVLEKLWRPNVGHAEKLLKTDQQNQKTNQMQEHPSSVRLGFCMVATGKPLEKILPEASFSLTNSL
jgi:hypothetical protein